MDTRNQTTTETERVSCELHFTDVLKSIHELLYFALVDS